jgi:hypothetical protein
MATSPNKFQVQKINQNIINLNWQTFLQQQIQKIILFFESCTEKKGAVKM